MLRDPGTATGGDESRAPQKWLNLELTTTLPAVECHQMTYCSVSIFSRCLMAFLLGRAAYMTSAMAKQCSATGNTCDSLRPTSIQPLRLWLVGRPMMLFVLSARFPQRRTLISSSCGAAAGSQERSTCFSLVLVPQIFIVSVPTPLGHYSGTLSRTSGKSHVIVESSSVLFG